MDDLKKVAITGGTGLIGQKLVQQLLSSNYHIRLLTRKPELLNDLPIDNLEICKGDLLDNDSLSRLVEGVSVVFHLAGEIQDHSRFASVNVNGTENIISACRARSVSTLMYLSSTGVYGANGNARIVDETTSTNPLNDYEISKYTAELLVINSCQSNFNIRIIRPTIVFGEGKKFGKNSFLKFLRSIKARNLVLLGNNYINSYIYSGDVAAVSEWSVEQSKIKSKIYIINEPVLLTSFVNEIAKILGVPPPKVLPAFIGEKIASLLKRKKRFGSLYNQTNYSITKLTNEGFTLPFGYREGLRRTIAWYCNEGLL